MLPAATLAGVCLGALEARPHRRSGWWLVAGTVPSREALTSHQAVAEDQVPVADAARKADAVEELQE
jgi:hypothetical protein